MSADKGAVWGRTRGTAAVMKRGWADRVGCRRAAGRHTGMEARGVDASYIRQGQSKKDGIWQKTGGRTVRLPH